MAALLPPVIAELTASITEFQAKMAEAKGEMDSVGKSAEVSSSKMSSMGKGLLIGIAGAAIGVSAASIKMATDFQSSMELVHTQAHASQTEVTKMSAAVLNLAPSVGTGPDQLATSLYHIESDGFRGANALNALKFAAEGAKVGQANLEDVTNAMGALIAGKLVPGTNNYSKAMGELNAIVGAGDMRMQDLANAMGTGIAATASVAGVSLQELGGALATFGDNNIRGSKAAIYLRQAIMTMIAPSKKAEGALATIGIGASQLGEDLRKPNGLVTAISDLKTHLDASGLDATHQAQVLAEAFGGAKTATGIEVLMSQLDRLKQKTADVGSGANSFGADWQATTKTFKFQLDQLGAGAEALGIKFGTWLIPKVEDLIHAVADSTEWLSNHKSELYALGAAAALVGGTMIATYLVNSIERLGSALADSFSRLLQFSQRLLGIGTANTEVEASNDAMAANSMTTADRMAAAADSMALSAQRVAEAIAASAGEITGSLAEVDASIATTSAEMDTLGGASAGMVTTKSGLLMPSTAAGLKSGAVDTTGAAAAGAGAGESAAVAEGAGVGSLAGAALPVAIVSGAAYLAGNSQQVASAINHVANTIEHLIGVPKTPYAGTPTVGRMSTQQQITMIQNELSDKGGGGGIYGEVLRALHVKFAPQPGGQPNNKTLTTELNQLIAKQSKTDPVAALKNILQQQGGQTQQQTAVLRQMSTAQAKDKSLNTQQGVLQGLRTNVQQQTAQYGAFSKQSVAAVNALQSTDAKFFPGLSKDTSIAKVNQGIAQQFGSLKQLVSKQQTLSTEKGLGNVTQATKSLKADQALLAKEQTAGASKQAINDTKGEITKLQSHLDELKSVSQKITKTEDTLNEMNSLKSSLQTIKATEETMRTQISNDLHTSTNSAKQGADAVRNAITSGVKITDMPQRNATVSGSVHMSVS